MIKTIFAFLLLASYPIDASAGVASGGGGGDPITRMLVAAQDYLSLELEKLSDTKISFSSDKAKEAYWKNRKELAKDVKRMRTELWTSDKLLQDPDREYSTWVRIVDCNETKNCESPDELVIQYSDDLSLYNRLVNEIPHRKPVRHETGTNLGPLFIDVLDFFLHEMGHRYELKEDDAWRFAYGIRKFLADNSELPTLYCKLSVAANSKAVTNLSFTVGPQFSFNEDVDLNHHVSIIRKSLNGHPMVTFDSNRGKVDRDMNFGISTHSALAPIHLNIYSQSSWGRTHNSTEFRCELSPLKD